MRVTAIVVVALSLVVATMVSAGENPWVRAFVTMNPGGYIHADQSAAPNSVVDTYLCFDCFGQMYPFTGGLTAVSLVLDYQCGGFVAGSADVTIFHPSAVTVIGGPDDIANGWVIAAPECVDSGPDGILCVARIPWFYTGPPGDILILPSPIDGQATVDCNYNIDFFCVLSHGAIGQGVQTPGDPDCDCGHQHITYVYCEPQGGENPTHPPTYWFDVDFHDCPAIEGPLYGFHVQTFDPNPENYTNWVEPPDWSHSVHTVDGTTWVSWCTDEQCCPAVYWFRFQFDNPNPSAWGEWMVKNWTGRCDPSWEGGAAESWDSIHSSFPDGYGRRVHVPVAPTAVEETSWGRIKSLYR